MPTKSNKRPVARMTLLTQDQDGRPLMIDGDMVFAGANSEGRLVRVPASTYRLLVTESHLNPRLADDPDFWTWYQSGYVVLKSEERTTYTHA